MGLVVGAVVVREGTELLFDGEGEGAKGVLGHAFDGCQELLLHVGGKGGGGRADMAQAGGPNSKDSQDALNAIKAALAVEVD